MGQALQTKPNQDSILSQQRNHVSDGSNGDQFQKMTDDPFSAGGLEKGLNQFEDHSYRSQILVRVSALLTEGIQNGIGIGIGAIGNMMIGDDQVESQLTGHIRCLKGPDPVIDSDDQTIPILRSLFQCILLNAVSFFQSPGHVKTDRGTQHFQGPLQDYGGGNAVDIIVPINQYLLSQVPGLKNTTDDTIHIFHQVGIMKVFQAGLEKFPRLIRIVKSPLKQQMSYQRGNLQLSGQRLDLLRET